MTMRLKSRRLPAEVQCRPIHQAARAVATLALLAVVGWMMTFGSLAVRAAESQSAHEAMARRLTPTQYRAVIRDVFGLKVGGRFEPDIRVDGLLEAGTARIGVSPMGMEQYDVIARGIADQVLGDTRSRAYFVQCKPQSSATSDSACARQFIAKVGGLLFRRPLTEELVQIYSGVANAAAESSKDFHAGLSVALATLLVSPQFLFRKDVIEPDPDRQGEFRLDAYSKATRLSFFLWNSGPDEQLLKAAASGELHALKVYAREVDRMVASPRLENGVRAFFSDMLHFDQFSTLSKDPIIFPKLGTHAVEDAQEQTLRTIVELLVNRRGDYRDLFTTKDTFMTRSLAAIYKVPFALNIPNGSFDGWRPYTFAADDPRAGILMQISFVALHSHPGRSSPTLRGKALRELLLCQKVPAPPAAVQFDIVQDTSNPVHKTARERLTAHLANPVCAGCHKLIDPIGLALENFDGGGGFRTRENGQDIDTSGQLGDISFASAAELGQVLHALPATSSCLVDRLAAYALGRSATADEVDWSKELKTQFVAGGFRIPDLMQRTVLHPQFVAGLKPVDANGRDGTTLAKAGNGGINEN